MMPDIPFLVLGLLCDAGWITHLIAGCLYFRECGFQSALDWLLLAALAGVICGVAYIIHIDRIHEKEIATKLQKNLGFGLAVYAGLAGEHTHRFLREVMKAHLHSLEKEARRQKRSGHSHDDTEARIRG